MNLDDLLKSIREEDDDSKGGRDLDDLLASIRSEETSRAINPVKFFDNDKYDNFYKELVEEGTVDDQNLSEEERQKGIAIYRSDKLNFKKFVIDIQSIKPEVQKLSQEPIIIKEQFFTAPEIKSSFKEQFFTAPETAPEIKSSFKDQFFIAPKIKSSKLIPSKDEQISEELEKKLDELISAVRESNELEEDIQDDARKLELRRRRKEREDRIESKKFFKLSIKDLTSKNKTVGGFFDALKRFLGFTLLGALVNTLYGWFTDPNNKGKVEAIKNFFLDYWPALLGAAAYFLTPFGTLVNFVVGTVGKFLVKLGLLVAKNPILAAALGVGVGAEVLRRRSVEATEQIVEREEEKAGKELTPEEQADELSKPFNILETLTRILLPSLNEKVETQPVEGRSGGGLNMGTDTVPAMLTPGEFIMSRGAVNMFGADTMMAMNKAGGGTNRPKYGKVMGYQQGGMVGAEPPKLPQKGKDFWTLVAVAGTEDNDPQAWADVAQSIYNRQMSGLNFNQTDNSISGFILGKEQYEPTWKLPEPGKQGIPNPDWYNINDIQTASIATGKSIAYLQRVADAIQNPTYQKKARKFVGGKTDFMGGDEKPRFDLGDVRRGKQGEDNFFGFFAGPAAEDYGKTSPSAAEIPSFVGTQLTIPLPQDQNNQPEKSKPKVMSQNGDQNNQPEKSKPKVMSQNGEMMGPAFGDDRTAYVQGARTEIGKLGRLIFDVTGARDIFQSIKERLPVGAPNVPTSSRTIILPPIEAPEPPSVNKQSNDIPEFKITSGSRMRKSVSRSLGIHDLVGTK